MIRCTQKCLYYVFKYNIYLFYNIHLYNNFFSVFNFLWLVFKIGVWLFQQHKVFGYYGLQQELFQWREVNLELSFRPWITCQSDVGHPPVNLTYGTKKNGFLHLRTYNAPQKIWLTIWKFETKLLIKLVLVVQFSHFLRGIVSSQKI